MSKLCISNHLGQITNPFSNHIYPIYFWIIFSKLSLELENLFWVSATMLLEGLWGTKKRRWEMRCLYNFRTLQWEGYWEGYPHEICDSLIHHFLKCFPISNILCDKELIIFKLGNSKSCSTHKVLFILKSILDHLLNHLPHTHSLKKQATLLL